LRKSGGNDAIFGSERRTAVVLVSPPGDTFLAQDLFAPRLYVNDRAITNYEVEQRALFLRVLRAPGNPEEEALKALTEDRLRQTEAERLGIKLVEKDLTAGLTEFASRANLTAEEFAAELEKAGIAAETFRDFVAAGVLWRQVVRAKFMGQVPISEADIDKALEAATRPKALGAGQNCDPALPARGCRDGPGGAVGNAVRRRRFARRHAAPAAPPPGPAGGWTGCRWRTRPCHRPRCWRWSRARSRPFAVPGPWCCSCWEWCREDKTAEPISISATAEFRADDGRKSRGCAAKRMIAPR
jgi:hypothetical protein